MVVLVLLEGLRFFSFFLLPPNSLKILIILAYFYWFRTLFRSKISNFNSIRSKFSHTVSKVIGDTYYKLNQSASSVKINSNKYVVLIFQNASVPTKARRKDLTSNHPAAMYIEIKVNEVNT